METLKPLRSPHTVRGRPTLKDVLERFWNGSIRELEENAKTMPKTPNEMPSNSKERSDYWTTIQTDLNVTKMKSNDNSSEHCSSDVENESFAKQNFESEPNNKKAAILDDKHTQRSTLKCKYFSIFFLLNILFLLFDFIIFSSCKIRIDFAQMIIFIIVLIVNVVFYIISIWTCLLKDKAVHFTDVHKHNDVLVSIKVQEFRSRREKFVFYNCSRVVCYCHGSKRDREPSRLPLKTLKRLSTKNRKLRSYI